MLCIRSQKPTIEIVSFATDISPFEIKGVGQMKDLTSFGLRVMDISNVNGRFIKFSTGFSGNNPHATDMEWGDSWHGLFLQFNN